MTISFDVNDNVIQPTEEEKAENLEYMMDILNQLLDGKTMSELAAADTSTRLVRSETVVNSRTGNPDFLAILATLEEGEYSGIVEFEMGYYIYHLLECNSEEITEIALADARFRLAEEKITELYEQLKQQYPVKMDEEKWSSLIMGEIIIDPVLTE